MADFFHPSTRLRHEPTGQLWDQPGGRGGNPHHTSIRPNFGRGGVSTPDKKISLLVLIILALTAYWLLSFFGQSIVPGVQHTARFIDTLSAVIVLLIIVKFLS